MLYRKKILLGLVLELDVAEGEYVGKYRTRIEEVGEKIIAVGAPIVDGEVVPLREGTKVKLIYWDEVSAYSFEGEIMQRVSVPIPMFILELPDSITKVQRRNFVRVPATYPFNFQILNQEGLSDVYKGTMIDLSGGGIRFLTEERMENKSLIYAQLNLPSGTLETPLRVCRVERTEDSKRYRVSTEFHELAERVRDRIIRCVFDIQRDLRKKGLV